MYEQLSRGITFYHVDEIEHKQLNVALSSWIEGKQPVYDFDPEHVTCGSINEWQSQIIITVSGGYPPRLIDSLRKNRDSGHQALAGWFEQCRSRRDRSFQYALNIERDGCRDGLIAAYRGWLQRRWEIAQELRAHNFDDLLPTSAVDTFHIICGALKKPGLTDEQIGQRIIDFLNSDKFRDMPVNLIATRLYAMIAYKAVNGQKRRPSPGMSKDIEIISTLMPYCDAMFIDNECRSLLENTPRKYALDFPTRVFSQNIGDKFIKYLQDIEANADPTLLKEVHQVYGEPTPFFTMYEVERQMNRSRELSQE